VEQSRPFYTFVSTFLIAIVIGTFVSLPKSVLIVLFLAGITCIYLYKRVSHEYYLYIGLTLLSCSLGLLRLSYAEREIPKNFETFIGGRIFFSGLLVSSPDIRESGERIIIEVSDEGATTKILAVVSGSTHLQIGDTVSVGGILKKPKPFDTDGGRVFAYGEFLAKDGIFGIVQNAVVIRTGSDTRIQFVILRFLESIKNYFVDSLERSLNEPQSSLAAGLLTGGKQGLGKELITAFTISGLLQILVLSGYNVMIVMQGIVRMLWFLPKRIQLSCALIGIILFIVIAGAGTSAVRAGIMAVFAVTARSTGKTYNVIRAMSVTLVGMLLWNPLLLVYDPGLQFSFIATLGLIIGTPLLMTRLLWIKNNMLREVTATSISAQVAVLPILLWQTGNLSLVALFATILVMPVIPLAMALAAIAGIFGSIFVGVFSGIAIIGGFPAHVFLSYIIEIAQGAAKISFAQVIISVFPFWVVLVLYALLTKLVFVLKEKDLASRRLAKSKSISFKKSAHPIPPQKEDDARLSPS
jgi:competence protein ComEC